MGFIISHTFDCSSSDYISSPKVKNGNIEWYMRLKYESSEVTVYLFGKNDKAISRSEVCNKLTVDVCCKIGKVDPAVSKNNTIDATKYSSGSGKYITCLKLYIYNIRTEGLRKYNMLEFDKRDSNQDLTLNVNGQKLHCHSQILSWNSKVFKALMEMRDPTTSLFQPVHGTEASYEFNLAGTIPIEDFRELLHHIYFPNEPVDEHNFRQLLHWGNKFEVNHIVQLCEQFMESQLLGTSITDESKLEIFLLSWKYSIEPLKTYSARITFISKASSSISKITRNEIYSSMDDIHKVEMWEHLIEVLYNDA